MKKVISLLLALALCLWAVSDNPVSPLVGPLVGLTATAYVERRFRYDAWSHIPRRRQDLVRSDPGALTLAFRIVEPGKRQFVVVAQER